MNSPEKFQKFKKRLPAQITCGNGSKPARESGSHGIETEEEKDLKSALRLLEKAVRTHPDDAANWFDYGKLLSDIGQDQLAERALQEAARRVPNSANYQYYLGNALGNNGKFPEAAKHFQCLAEIDPELKDPMSLIGLSALTDLGYCLGEMGDWAGAYNTLQPALRTAISILGDLAGFLSGAGEFDHSCFLYTVALFLSPEDAGLLHGAGYCHMKRDRLDVARDHLRKAAKADPEDPDIWYDLGLTLAKMKKGKEARLCFRKVLQLDAKHSWAWYDLACLEALGNKPAAAFRNLYKAIECGFKDADYLLRDSDFKNIRNDPRWNVVLECISVKANSDETGRAPQQ